VRLDLKEEKERMVDTPRPMRGTNSQISQKHSELAIERYGRPSAYYTANLEELWLSCAGPGKRFLDRFNWGPDVFAFSSRFLEETGSYTQAVSPPQGQQWLYKDWQKQAVRDGRAWAEWINKSGRTLPRTLPRTLQWFHDTLFEEKDKPVEALSKNWNFVQMMLRLHATCDEAGAGLGIPGRSDLAAYSQEATRLLIETGSLSHFPPQRVRVLPKMNTPQMGIELRSLSHHLAAIHNSETHVKYTLLPIPKIKRKRLGLLLIPWPYDISADAFSIYETDPLPTIPTEYFGFFKFAPVEEPPIEKFVELVKKARRISEGVDMIILPETALTERQLHQLETALDDDADLNDEEEPVIVAGVRDDTILGNFGSNHVVFSYLSAFGDRERIFQAKHHRWALDESQILNYDLGEQLSPAKRWWEAIDIPERSLCLLAIADWLMLCPLVCEDLARQEPLSRTLRAIGPTLVITLLLDGPQLAQRWPHRYAGVLSDDPHSSVLTVTSLGMAMRSSPPGYEPRPVVASWKDALSGYREISLNPGNEALLLSVAPRPQRQWSADGRDRAAANLTLIEGIYEL
jgi:hypothetical protein